MLTNWRQINDLDIIVLLNIAKHMLSFARSVDKVIQFNPFLTKLISKIRKISVRQNSQSLNAISSWYKRDWGLRFAANALSGALDSENARKKRRHIFGNKPENRWEVYTWRFLWHSLWKNILFVCYWYSETKRCENVNKYNITPIRIPVHVGVHVTIDMVRNWANFAKQKYQIFWRFFFCYGDQFLQP